MKLDSSSTHCRLELETTQMPFRVGLGDQKEPAVGTLSSPDGPLERDMHGNKPIPKVLYHVIPFM